MKPVAEIELRAAALDLDPATAGLEIGGRHLTRGDAEKALEIFRKIVERKYWSAFGYIAAEAELARQK